LLEVKTGLFSSKDVIVGYQYYVGVQLGIARAVDAILAIDWDDLRLASFSPELEPGANGEAVSVNEPDFLGGDEGSGVNGGGIVGTFRFYAGRSDQTVNAYLSNFQDPISAYRHMAYCVMEGVYIGTRPSIAPIAFVAKRLPNGLWTDPPPGPAYWVVTQANGTEAANAAAVIYELLTDTDFGLALPAATIDADSFRTAGEQLWGENHGYSNLLVSKSDARSVINDVLRQIDATLFIDFETGLFTLKLIRTPTGSPPPTPIVFNESNVVEVEDFTRGNWTDTTNRIIVNWKDPFLPVTPSPAVQDDMANQRLQNRNVTATFNYPGISDPTLAAQVAARELRGLAFPLAKCTFVATRDAISLRPGDLLELQWDDLGIASMNMRVTSIAIGGSEDIRVRVSCLQDIYTSADVVYAAPAPSGWSNPTQVGALATLADACFEAPLFMDRLSPLTSPVVADSEQDSRIVLAPVPNQQNITGFRMMVSTASPADFTTGDVVSDFGDMTPSGLLADSIAQDQFLNSSSPVTITIQQGVLTTYLQGATETEIEAQLANLCLINDEFFSYETRTYNSDGTVTLGGIHRAKLDTVPAAHSIGDRVYFLARGTAFTGGITTNRYAVDGGVGARPITSKGILDAASANVCGFTPTNRVFRPYRPAQLTVATSGSPIVPASYFPSSLPRQDWVFSWDDRDRRELSDIDVNETTAQSKETGTEVVIQFLSATLSPELRREVTFTGATQSYTYTVALQDTDFGGPGSPMVSPSNQDIIVRVFSRRTTGPLSGLESHGIWQWTITRTGVV